MTRSRSAPAYLIVSNDEERRNAWRDRFKKHALVRAAADAASARLEVEGGRRTWAGFIVDIDGYTRAVARLVRDLHRASPNTPGLLVHTGPSPDDELESLGFRCVRPDDSAELRSLLGRGLALAVTDDRYVLDAVVALGREHGLTPKQMELLALSTAPLDRHGVVETLGVSNNTLKTRVRQILKLFEADSMDALGKSVLRAALDRAREDVAGSRATSAERSPGRPRKRTR